MLPSRGGSALATILFTILITGLDGLRNVRLEGPHFVRVGDDVILRCNYELENESIYAVKWYRGTQEFYRFVPKEVPPKRFFNTRGLAFNERYCNEHEIFLKNVSLETTGKFKCAVSAEMTFQTFIAVQDLVVAAVEYYPPKIEVEQQSYYPGESARANCSLEKVSHQLNFTWYINNQEVPKTMTKSVSQVDPEDPGLIKSISLLNFEMGTNPNPNPTKGDSVNGDDTRLKCKAELFDLYSESSKEIVIQTTQPRYSPSNQGTRSSASSPISSNTSGGAAKANFSRNWILFTLLASVLSLSEVLGKDFCL